MGTGQRARKDEGLDLGELVVEKKAVCMRTKGEDMIFDRVA